MNQQEIEKYVADYLSDATTDFLEEIIKHGIYGSSADIIAPQDDDEYDELADEFYRQAEALLNK